ncbi:MAG: redox-sensing transcriptional repressor [Chthoniobacter sp.]|nr:redox-sensing transcriptional repressor [Chthoniobacter sp.]
MIWGGATDRAERGKRYPFIKFAISGFLAPFHKMQKLVIPRKTVYRLSLYYRALQRLRQNSIVTVSSAALAKAAGVKPTQLRKDLTYFGQFGTRGLGYNVTALSSKLTHVLGTTHLQPVILVGAGNLGSALLRYPGFAKEGFEVVAAFDMDATRKRSKDLGVKVLGMSKIGEFVRTRKIKMAILTVPSTVAQEVTNALVEAGVLAILNFAPIILQVPDHVVVNNVDLAIELENLSYFIQ